MITLKEFEEQTRTNGKADIDKCRIFLKTHRIYETCDWEDLFLVQSFVTYWDKEHAPA